MANGTRTLSLAIGFVVALAVGCSIGHSQPSPQPEPTPPPQTTPVPTASPVATTECPPADHQLIEIGPKASEVSKECAVISLSKGHKVLWLPQDPNDKLEITFKVSDFPTLALGQPPFEGGEKDKPQVIKRHVFGGYKPVQINQKLKDPLASQTKGFEYKYWQTLIHPNGTLDKVDARIIIEK